MKFTENPCSGSRVFHADGQTDIPKLIVAFRNFANAPKTNLKLSHETSVRFIRMDYLVGKK
jgi:hypothetical protein